MRAPSARAVPGRGWRPVSDPLGWMAVALALCLSGVGAAQSTPPVFPQDGATLERENAFISVWRVARPPETEAIMRRVTVDQVAVTLAPGTVRITRPDGTESMEHEPVGFVRYEPAGTIRAIGAAGDTHPTAVVFQVKTRPETSWPMTEGIPGQFPRVGATLLFETEGVRVWDQTWQAGVRIANHFHYAPTAAVFLEGGGLRTLDEHGLNPPFGRERGDVIASDTPMDIPHEEDQVEGAPRAIWLELKPLTP